MSSLDTDESFKKEENVANEKPATGAGDISDCNEPEAQGRGLVISRATIPHSINLSVEI
jgi:hypothetical protein